MSQLSPYQGLHPSIIGSATVLNDGTSPNKLRVAFTNGNMFDGSSGEVNIVIKKENTLAFFFITDDSDGSGGKDADNLTWALATRSQILAATTTFFPAINNTGKNNGITWTVAQHPVQGQKISTNNPTTSTLQGWLFTPSADFTLEPGDSLILELSNIITKLPDGPSMAYMYIKYDDMVNGINQSNHFIRVGPILKGPNFISGQKVGIGTNKPLYPLSIRADSSNKASDGGFGPKISLWDGGNTEQFFGFSISPGSLNYQVHKNCGHYFRANGTNNDGNLLMSINDFEYDSPKERMGLVRINGYLGIGIPDTTYAGIKLAIGDVNTGIDHDPGEGLLLKVKGEERLQLSANGHIGLLGTQIVYQVDSENEDHIFISKETDKAPKELLRIKGNGNVGIGNSDPKFPLHFAAEVGTKISLYNNSVDEFYGFGISNGQLDYLVPGSNAHVFSSRKKIKENQIEDRKLMRLYHNDREDSGVIDFMSYLKADGEPLFVHKQFENLDNPSYGYDTGIDYATYFAMTGGFSGSEYQMDYLSHRGYQCFLVAPTADQAKKNNTWRLNMHFSALSDKHPGKWTIIVFAIHRKLANFS